jgi:hypothetical protein
VDVDHGQFVGRSLSHVAFVVDLHELAPAGGRAAGGCERRRFERFAEVSENLADGPGLGDERDEPDVADAVYWSDGTQSLACGEMLRNGGRIFGELF